MPWELEIDHFGLTGSGDATLVIAREVAPLAGPVAEIRSALIDGGRIGEAGALHAFIAGRLGATPPGPNPLNVMVCTHFEADHMPGLTSLLLRVGRYDNTIIYDQGWPNPNTDQNFLKYLRAINGLNDNGPVAALAGVNRVRVTSEVQSDGVPVAALTAPLGPPAEPPGGAQAAMDGPAWLLTSANAPQEILWDDLQGGAAPAGAPRMRIIAVNKFAYDQNGGVAGPLGVANARPNAKSLAVEIIFNNFRYYIGGDIETAEEDEIQQFLNPNTDTPGRVLGMKASHHGANTATSRDFVDQLVPEAVFFSCGNGNTHGHPSAEVINIVDGYEANNGVQQGPPPPEPPWRPVRSYMTGYHSIVPLESFGGALTMTAGDPGPPVIRGTIRITISQAQSNAPVIGRLYTAVREAVRAVAAYPALAGSLTAAQADDAGTAAAEAALAFGCENAASAVCRAAGLPAALQTAAQNAATAAYNANQKSPAMANSVTTAAMAAGVPVAIAAAAGAAAGTRRGNGENANTQTAVRQSLVAAGVPMAAAALAGLNVVNTVNATCLPHGQFTVTFYQRSRLAEQDYIHL